MIADSLRTGDLGSAFDVRRHFRIVSGMEASVRRWGEVATWWLIVTRLGRPTSIQDAPRFDQLTRYHVHGSAHRQLNSSGLERTAGNYSNWLYMLQVLQKFVYIA